MRFSYSHHAHVGHQVKSRAATNEILYNQLMDEANGDASYIVDIPNGGRTYLVGNLIQQGPRAENWTLVSYAAEGNLHETNELVVLNNTFVNDRKDGVFVKNHNAATKPILLNNIFSGKGLVIEGAARSHGNLVTEKRSVFRDARRFDYHLAKGSRAIGVGVDPARFSLPFWAEYEYHHPTGKRRRVMPGPIDAGAYQFTP
jgi:hypothetical protein